MRTKPKSPTTSPSISHAASSLGVDPELVREAKRAGCKAFDSGGRVRLQPLRQWIARHRKPGKAKAASSSPDPSANVAGLGASLSRLAAQERELFERLRAATGTSAEVSSRKSWLAVCEQLRKADSAVAEGSRDANEFLARSEVETLLEDFAKLVVQSTRDTCWAIAMAAQATDPRTAAAESLGPARNWLRNVGAIAVALHPKPIPGWAISAWGKGLGNGLRLDGGEFEGMTDALRDVLALAVSEPFSELMNGTPSPERK